MARVEIRHKCITIAREAARRDSSARVTGRSVFIKRYYGKYRLIGVEVSKKQRNCRDLFAEAQRLAKEDLRTWNRKRHWAREAKRHKIKGAHRMAVSAFYKLLNNYELRIKDYETCGASSTVKLSGANLTNGYNYEIRNEGNYEIRNPNYESTAWGNFYYEIRDFVPPGMRVAA